MASGLKFWSDILSAGCAISTAILWIFLPRVTRPVGKKPATGVGWVTALNSAAEPGKKAKTRMKESTLAKITASVRVAKGMAERAIAASPNPHWTEYELHMIDEWIACQGEKLHRSEAIRRLVHLGLKVK